MAKEIDKIIKKNQYLNSQIEVFSGQINNENILDNDYQTSLKDYEEIYFNDVLAKTTIDLLLSPIKQANYKIILKNSNNLIERKAKKLIENTLNNLLDGFEFVKQMALFSIITGSQFFEIVWNVEQWEGIFFNRIIRLLPIKNENIINYLYNEKGDFIGLEIFDNTLKENKQILKTDLFYVIHNQFFNDVRGISELKTIVKLCKLKQMLLKHSERTIARGVGVPIAYATENFDISKIEDYKKILRNIANTDGAYALISKNDIDRIEFLTVNQNNIMPLLEFLNRDIFFNTLTQFLTTGLGQNGARATAEELKSPYLLKLKTISNELESYFQWLCNIIIDNSSLAIALKKENYPIFRFTNITDLDLQKFITTLQALVGLGLKLTNVDFDYLRDLLQLPNKNENIETEGQLNYKKDKKHKNCKNCKNKKLDKVKINDFNFEIEKIKKLYDYSEMEIEKNLNKIIDDLVEMIYYDKKYNIDFDFYKIYNFLLENFTNLQKKIKNEASNTALLEIKKLKRDITGIKLNEETETGILQFILKIVNNLKDLEITNETTKDDIKKQITNKIKKETREIKNVVEKEIQNGRGEIFEQSNIKKFRYTAVLDDNVCDVCRSSHDLIFDIDEIEFLGFNLKSPVNPKCLGVLGGNRCRCQLIPIE